VIDKLLSINTNNTKKFDAMLKKKNNNKQQRPQQPGNGNAEKRGKR